LKDEFEDLSEIVQNLKAHVAALENIHHRASALEAKGEHGSGSFNLQDILTRINAVQDLVDRIEIELDNLEMRVSSIEHMGFRIKTGGP
jgi:prefoldin subunit 5